MHFSGSLLVSKENIPGKQKLSLQPKKAAAEAAAFFSSSIRVYQKPYAVRGKGSTSRMFWMPVRYMIIRSKPRP